MNESSPPRDHVPPEPDETDESNERSMEDHLKSSETWLRLVFMLVMILIYGISRIVVVAVMAIQFFYVLFTGQINEQLRQFGQSLAIYSYQIVRYLTFNTNERPFPFDQSWPLEGPDLRTSE